MNRTTRKLKVASTVRKITFLLDTSPSQNSSNPHRIGELCTHTAKEIRVVSSSTGSTGFMLPSCGFTKIDLSAKGVCVL